MTNSRDLRPGSESRLFLAFAVQPFATALLAFVLFPIVEYTGRPLYGGQPASFLDGAVAFAMGVGVTALFVTVLAALPLFVWLQKRGPVTSEQVFASGAILGNLPSALIMASLVLSGSSRGASTDLDSVVYGPAGLIRAIVVGTVVGLCAAWVFWRVAGRQIGPVERHVAERGAAGPGLAAPNRLERRD